MASKLLSFASIFFLVGLNKTKKVGKRSWQWQLIWALSLSRIYCLRCRKSLEERKEHVIILFLIGQQSFTQYIKKVERERRNKMRVSFLGGCWCWFLKVYSLSTPQKSFYNQAKNIQKLHFYMFFKLLSYWQAILSIWSNVTRLVSIITLTVIFLYSWGSYHNAVYF